MIKLPMQDSTLHVDARMRVTASVTPASAATPMTMGMAALVVRSLVGLITM
jgi:hypothetical protein